MYTYSKRMRSLAEGAGGDDSNQGAAHPDLDRDENGLNEPRELPGRF